MGEGLGPEAEGDELSPRPGNLAVWAQGWSESAGDAERPGTEPSGGLGSGMVGLQGRRGNPAVGAPRSRKEQVSAV